MIDVRFLIMGGHQSVPGWNSKIPIFPLWKYLP